MNSKIFRLYRLVHFFQRSLAPTCHRPSSALWFTSTKNLQTSSLLLHFVSNGAAKPRDTNSRDSDIDRLLIDLERYDHSSSNGIGSVKFLPHLCSISATPENGFERRFAAVSDRWWNRLRQELNTGRADLKLTSIIHHLGRMNQQTGGLIVEKMGPEAIRILFDEASKTDLCSLGDIYDFMSYLHGIRDLVRAPYENRIVHPSLVPRNVEFFHNIERYLREKAISRRDENGNDDWLYTITEESIGTLIVFLEMEIDLRTLRQSGDGLLTILCSLIKEGYETRIRLKKTPQTFYFFAFAHAWLFWKIDPDRFVDGMWRAWFTLYEKNLSTLTEPEAKVEKNYLMCLGLVAEATYFFRKIDDFTPISDCWLADLKQILHSDRRKRDILQSCDTFALSCYLGNLAAYLASIGKFNIIEQMRSSFLRLAADSLDSADPSVVDFVTLQRYFVALRDFKSAIAFREPRFQYSNKFKSKVCSYLTRYIDQDRRKDAQDSPAIFVKEIASILQSLARADLSLDAKIFHRLLGLFEQKFIGVCDEMLINDPDGVRYVLIDFGGAMTLYSRNYRYTSEKIWPEYFRIAKLYLESIKPERDESTTSFSDDSFAQVRGDTFVLSVLLSVVLRFKRIDDFRRIQSIWERRTMQLSITPKVATYKLEEMAILSKEYQIRFDPALIKHLQDLNSKWRKERVRK